MFDALYKKPTWFMWGVENEDDTVTLIATHNINDFTALMTYSPETIGTVGAMLLTFAKPTVEFHGKTVEFEVITMKTFPDAFNELSRRWKDA